MSSADRISNVASIEIAKPIDFICSCTPWNYRNELLRDISWANFC